MSDSPDTLDQPVTYELEGNVAIIRFDDGKANALGHDVLATIQAMLTRAETDQARAVAIVGRPGKFSAGFDLAVMMSGPDQARDLLRAGADLALRIFTFPMPVVLGVTGHALAMGAILLMAADVRIGANGPFKVGLPEVEIGMPLPKFAVEFARDRLDKRYFLSAVAHAVITDPAGAIDVNFLDRVVEPDAVETATLEQAHDMADRLRAAAFIMTRTNSRQDTAEAIQVSLDADIAAFSIGQS
ncbi:MAG: crotonase/enoyl-CoA hydratase family protein [Actinomycetes bacterium]